ncbi:MAG: hypothetical protein SOX56_07715 [[Pasteurella] mairii]|uniref:Uncharacterized protein n=1 Tax=[Pasteurella] mairii TaxID=757 RepID=A0A379B2G5_9PAST|nr:hypothetical protein [[Pasteurella] mairii]SUB32813.1 Uncharacterised protein [[Pasteurella] mairii]
MNKKLAQLNHIFNELDEYHGDGEKIARRLEHMVTTGYFSRNEAYAVALIYKRYKKIEARHNRDEKYYL